MLSYPDYDRCLINIISSIKNYYRSPFEYPTLPSVDSELKKFYKNIVLVVLDGLGTDMLVKNLDKHDFLRKNCKGNITSVFPTTTASAMTSYYSGLSPNEHAWLGWSLYFKEFNHTIDVFKNVDTYIKTPVAQLNVADFVMPYETIYYDIKHSAIGNVQPFTVAQKNIKIAENGNYHKTTDNFDKACETVKLICDSNQNTFTFFQWSSPDDVAHRHGCYAKQTKECIKDINDKLEKLYNSVSDTLFIISADHGMIDIEEEILLHQIPELVECLVIPPFCESRAMSFYVKYDKRADFEKIFASRFAGDFILMSKRDILAKEILGRGKIHPKTLDFVGDYMAIAIGDKALRYRTLNTKPKPMNPANHGGITDKEMDIPLIIASTEQTTKPKFFKLF